MKEMNDEELQHLAAQSDLISNDLSSAEVKDVAAYRALFTQLQAEPAAGLPLNFAANVRRAVRRRAERKEDLRFQVMQLFFFTGILAIAFGLLHLISPEAIEQLSTISPKFKWSAGLAVVVFWSIHFGSQGLIKDKEY